MKKFQLSAINNPSIEIECGGVVMSTNKIKNAKKNPNFDSSSLFFDVVRELSKLIFYCHIVIVRRNNDKLSAIIV